MPYYSPENLTKTKVKGLIVDELNQPYKGALIEFQLNKSFTTGGTFVNNTLLTTKTNSFGRFEIDLLPSALDNSSTNFYNTKIYYDRVFLHKIIIPVLTVSITLSELIRNYTYIQPSFFSDTLGNDCSTDANQYTNQNSQQPSPNMNMQPKFSVINIDSSNVNQSVFLVDGNIDMVIYNGIVMTKDQDFMLNSQTSIRIIPTSIVLTVGDRISIRYYPS